MGNIIGLLIEGSSGSGSGGGGIFNANGSGKEEPLTGEQGEAQTRRDKGEAERIANNAGTEASRAETAQSISQQQPPHPSFGTFDVKAVKDYANTLNDLFSQFNLQSTNSAITAIETAILDLYNSVAYSCINLIKDTLVTMKQPMTVVIPQDQAFQNFGDVLVSFVETASAKKYKKSKEVMEKIAENFKVVGTITDEKLKGFVSIVSDMNKRWHSAYDDNENIKRIDQYIKENLEFLVGFDTQPLTDIKNEIKALLAEGDIELKSLKSIYESFHQTIASQSDADAVSILTIAFKDLYDLYDDDSRLSELITLAATFEQTAKNFVAGAIELRTNKSTMDDIVNAFNSTSFEIEQQIGFMEVTIAEDDERTSATASFAAQLDTFLNNANEYEDIDLEKVQKVKNEYDAMTKALAAVHAAVFSTAELDTFLKTNMPIATLLQATALTDSLSDDWKAKYQSIDMNYYNALKSQNAEAKSKFVSADEACDTAYQTFMTSYATLTGDLSTFFYTLDGKNKEKITEWETGIEEKNTRMNNNYANISTSSIDVINNKTRTSTIELKLTNLGNTISKIKDLYQKTFTNSNCFMSEYKKQKSIYVAIADTTEAAYLDIDRLSGAMFAVQKEMNAIDEAFNNSEIEFGNASSLITEIAKLQFEEEERLKRLQAETDYANAYAPISIQVTAKLAVMTNALELYSNVDKEIDPFDDSINDLFNATVGNAKLFDVLLQLGANNPDNEIAAKASESGTQASADRSSFDTQFNAIYTNMKVMKENAELNVSTLKKVVENASLEDVYARPAIKDIQVTVDGVDDKAIAAAMNSIESAKTSLGSIYANVMSTLQVAYDLASTIDSRFKEFAAKTIESYITVLTVFEKSLSTYKEQVNTVINKITQNANIMYCRYVELYNAIIVVDTGVEPMPSVHTYKIKNEKGEEETVSANCSEVLVQFENGDYVSTNLKDLYTACANEWKLLQPYATQAQVNKHSEIVKDIYNKIKSLKNAVETADNYLNDYNTKVRDIINATIYGFMTEFENVEKLQDKESEASLAMAQGARDMAIAAYNTCVQTIGLETAKQFDVIKEQTENSYNTAAEAIYGQLTQNIVALSQEINWRKRDIIRYTYAARLLAYIYGHYYIGRVKPSDEWQISYSSGRDTKPVQMNWKQWLLWEISTCLIPDEYKDSDRKLDVFKTLCLYTPVIPLIWPYGGSDIEKQIQTSDHQLESSCTGAISTHNFELVKGELITKYVSDQLVDYIYNAIVNTMNKTEKSPLEKLADFTMMTDTITTVPKSVDGIKEKTIDVNGTETKIEVPSLDKMLTDNKEYKEKCIEFSKLTNENYSYSEIMNKNKVAGTMDQETFDSLYKSNSDMNSSRSAYNDAKSKYDVNEEKLKPIRKRIEELRTQMEQDYDIKLKEFEQASSISIYWQRFIDEAIACAGDGSASAPTKNAVSANAADVSADYTTRARLNDIAFANVCVKYLDAVIDDDQYHNYWKLVVTASGKLNNLSSTPKYIPRAFPFISPSAEKEEAIIILANRTMAKLGYVSYDLMTNPGKAATPVLYNDFISQSLSDSIIPGGQCIGYNDSIAFNSRMHRNANGKVDDTYLFDIDDIYTTYSTFVKEQSNDLRLANINRCLSIGKYTMSNSADYYFKYINPTALFDYLFSDAAVDVSGLDALSIDNFCRNQPSETAVPALIQGILEKVNERVGFDSGETNYLLSTDYIWKYGGEMAKTVFEELLHFALNWKFVLPYMSQTIMETAKLGFEPIPKINSIIKNQQVPNTTGGTVSFNNFVYNAFNNWTVANIK